MTQTTSTTANDGKWWRKLHLRTPLDRPIQAVANRFGGSKAKEVERFLKFACVGVTGAVIDLGLLTVLQASVLPPADGAALPIDFNLMNLPFNFNVTAVPLHFNVALATTIAFISAVLSNFIWTSIWVYPESQTRSVRRQLTQFALISFIGWSARTLWITTTYVPMGAIVTPIAEPFIKIVRPAFESGPVVEKRVGSIASQLIAMVVVMIWNFFANRYWTFNDVDHVETHSD
jgi:putative flippase GtrA